MLKKTVIGLILGSAAIAAGQANAFCMGGDISSMVNCELQFQQQFYPWAWQQSVQAAQMTPDDQALPFNAMTISDSLSSGMRSFEGAAAQWHRNSDATMSAIEGYSREGITGNTYYQNPYSGSVYELPYSYGPYYETSPGYVHNWGADPWATPLTSYGW